MATKQLSDQEIQARFSRFQSDLQQLAQKIGELEAEAEEHELVLATLSDPYTNDPDRKCFRMIGGVLVERTVKDVVPSLEMNRNGVSILTVFLAPAIVSPSASQQLKGVLETLVKQYKSKEEDFNTFQREHKIRVLPKPTNVPPPATIPAEPLVPRPPVDIPKWILDAIPRLDLVIEDILCPGAAQFLAAVQPATLLRNAVVGVLLELYDAKTVPSHVKQLRLIIKEMEGVAATRLGARAREEIIGVVTHEVVHCFQYDGQGTAPIGLIEGVADFVRLRAGLAPPHWKRDEKGERWDAGYEKTGFFLDWLERTKGAGTVRKINLALCDTEYHKKAFWEGALGDRVEELWEQYRSN
ncbi:hypothetical protein FRC07_007962 [Ceratobasidium sp. 392]|nr:hypothetical protein FRC07_007962 [Ceratobasidium sp. 392]